MSNVATTVLLLFLAVTGLVTLYAALNAASAPFAIHMAVMVLWSLAFLLFALRRAKRP
jgi:Ca2+/Na+ antiporter